MAEAMLMSRYNQSYSEIQNMPFEKILFFIRLAEAEDQFEKQEIERQKAESRSKMRFRRR